MNAKDEFSCFFYNTSWRHYLTNNNYFTAKINFVILLTCTQWRQAHAFQPATVFLSRRRKEQNNTKIWVKNRNKLVFYAENEKQWYPDKFADVIWHFGCWICHDKRWIVRIWWILSCSRVVIISKVTFTFVVICRRYIQQFLSDTMKVNLICLLLRPFAIFS